jgi:RNA polymerase sigma-70 factor (ECF subfamily)
MHVDELIKGCKAGSRHHFSELYAAYAPAMYGICLRYSGNMEEAKDILQEGFIKVFLQLKTYDKARGSVEVWLKGIFVHAAIDFLRKRPMALFYPVEIVDNTADDDAANEPPPIELRTEELLQMVCDLPAGYRAVFNLHAIEEKTHPEIAALLGISEGTSKSQLMKARRMLQERIREKLARPKYKYGS